MPANRVIDTPRVFEKWQSRANACSEGRVLAFTPAAPALAASAAATSATERGAAFGWVNEMFADLKGSPTPAAATLPDARNRNACTHVM